MYVCVCKKNFLQLFCLILTYKWIQMMMGDTYTLEKSNFTVFLTQKIMIEMSLKFTAFNYPFFYCYVNFKVGHDLYIFYEFFNNFSN